MSSDFDINFGMDFFFPGRELQIARAELPPELRALLLLSGLFCLLRLLGLLCHGALFVCRRACLERSDVRPTSGSLIRQGLCANEPMFSVGSVSNNGPINVSRQAVTGSSMQRRRR